MRVCKFSYFEKCHDQLLYERMRKFSLLVLLVEDHASIYDRCPTTYAIGESEESLQNFICSLLIFCFPS